MRTTIEKPVRELSLETLKEDAAQEMRKYRRKELSDERYCLEIFRRAVVRRENEAWVALQALLSESVRLWFARHPCRGAALRYEPVEQNYIDETFRRFWQALSDQRLLFSSLAGALSYLHLGRRERLTEVHGEVIKEIV